MTTVQITLPDQLAQEAQRAGLLAPAHLERWLREQLQAQRTDELFAALERMAGVDQPPVMSPEEMAAWDDLADRREQELLAGSVEPVSLETAIARLER